MNQDSGFLAIPRSIAYSEDLTALQKLIYGEILSLSCNGLKCFETNEGFANHFGIKQPHTISENISRLKELGLVVAIVENEGTKNERRVLLPKVWGDYFEKYGGITSKSNQNNTVNNTINNISEEKDKSLPKEKKVNNVQLIKSYLKNNTVLDKEVLDRLDVWYDSVARAKINYETFIKRVTELVNDSGNDKNKMLDAIDKSTIEGWFKFYVNKSSNQTKSQKDTHIVTPTSGQRWGNYGNTKKVQVSNNDFGLMSKEQQDAYLATCNEY